MKPNRCILVALGMLMLYGCAGSAPGDAALDEPFPADRYLTAEATGDSEAEAGRAALAELAAIFESRVYVRTLQQATSWIGEGLSEQFDKAVEQTVNIQTDVRLEGARIGRVWQDASRVGFHALAVLDRHQAAGRWQRELATAQVLVAGQRQALDTAEGRLTRLTALNRITSALLRQAVIESRLSVLGRPVPPIAHDFTDIVAERETLAHDVALLIQLTGDSAHSFARRLTAQLTDEGYRIASRADSAAGLIAGTIGVYPLELNNPTVHFIRAVANVRLVDTDTGIQMAVFDEAVRKGHVDEDEAARRAVDGAARLVSRQLVRALGTLGVVADKSRP